MTGLEVRVLGVVEATGPAGTIALTSTRRVILGVLAVRAGQVVPYTELVDVLWGESPPRTAFKTLHSHVARIRQAFTSAGVGPVITTRDPGYVLDLAPERVDAHRFELLVHAARADLARGDTRAAVETLRTADGLWRGEPFSGIDLGEWGHHELDRLRELRLSATEDRWDAEIATGGAPAAALELPRLVAAEPLRERLTGLLMLALHRCGRHAEALNAYERLRHRLADELGADPGPELSELHTAILRRDAALAAPPVPPAPSQVPAQLPARAGHFTGRTGELSDLDDALGGDDPPIVVISGPAGMGKTSLAVQWAARIADRFPDGHLFLDLRGHDPDHAVTAEQALAHLLRGLDVPEDRIPAGVSARSALYRTLLHTRRCVVLADDAGAVDHVLPLVPGSDTSVLVVTSRRSLAGLVARHAVRHIVLDALDDASSVALLEKVLGRTRVAREPEATARLAKVCAGMPLALRIAAARLVGVPTRSVAELVAELSGARLEGLALEGDLRTVTAVLASAYRPLSPGAARLLRLLATVPTPTQSGHLGAAIADVPVATAHVVLGELSGAHLVIGAGEDRYRLHDLIREFARDRAAAEEPEPDVVAALLLDWYLLVADEANRLVNPDRDAVKPVFRFPLPPLPFAAGRHEATAFLESERDGFLPVVQYAREQGMPTAAWHLVYLLASFYEVSGHWTERVELCRAGLAAARDAGDRAGEAEMLRALGVAFYMTRRLTEAVETNLTALDVVRDLGDLAGEGHVLNNLANAYADLRRFDEAEPAFRVAAKRATAAGNRLGVGLAQRNLGYALVRMGRARESLAPLAAALAIFDGIGNVRLRAGTLDTLGEARRELGSHAGALRDFAEALAISREIGDRWLEWELLRSCGITHLAAGDPAAALDYFGQSLSVTRAVHDRNGEAIALQLIGHVHLCAGRTAEAAEHLALALAVRAQVPDGYEEAHLHRDLAALAAARGDDATAASHRGRAVDLYLGVNATAEAEALIPPGG
ncbi:AfsR/SARP family transcriptional regulator [Actinophytocola oryzae]|uniref:DNA-binding SARP family transcriptional activator n=1 Tax=Actinophytocola oryzae TaxID=502181 RepID=A0A4R7V7V1_9PSEU|nr:BTAD domain-containing putative transcriptional regulator [Actinophytocola oryzae]TDV44305.1 DNA-binding SARP family transcriptional activator [Actinophytocola oryzae]